jgi:heme/copper-type cytochrome/quinol oxidase subunit 1
MNKWIREKLDTWDLKSVFLTIIALSIFTFLFFYLTDIRDRRRQKNKEEFKEQTEAKVISAEPIDRITQSKWKGTQIVVDSYKIQYTYKVDGQEFQNIDLIPLTTKNKRYLATILDRKPNDIFSVRFDLNDPGKSILTESE